VDGTVAARSAAPASPWRASESIGNGGNFIAGPSATPINLTSLSISTDAASGNSVGVIVYGAQVPSSAMVCPGASSFVLLWEIRDLGDGATPLSFTFPTPLQWKPPANTKACLFAAAGTSVLTKMNAVGFYGG
jgi:hypothetical protein